VTEGPEMSSFYTSTRPHGPDPEENSRTTCDELTTYAPEPEPDALVSSTTPDQEEWASYSSPLTTFKSWTEEGEGEETSSETSNTPDEERTRPFEDTSLMTTEEYWMTTAASTTLAETTEWEDTSMNVYSWDKDTYDARELMDTV